MLDACVLFPTVPRCLLEACAAEGLMTPIWSERILEEWRRAVHRTHPAQAAAVEDEIAAFRARFAAGCVKVEAALEAMLSLPDPADRHVLAAAIEAEAAAIVTFNMKDFPGRTVGRYGLTVRHPDSLLSELATDAPQTLKTILGEVFTRLPEGLGPPRRVLKRAGLPRFAKLITD